MAAGTSHGITGAKTPPAAPGAVPKQTYIGGSMTLKVGGRRAELTHVTNAHTDGDTWDLLHGWLLRARRKGPRRGRDAEQRDERAPAAHSITSSARPSSVSGKVMPIALAAFRLIIS